MKKIITILLTFVLVFSTLISCGSNEEKTDINVAVLSGTTGFGMAQLMEKNANSEANNNYSFSIESDAKLIIAGLSNNSIDIAALPTNAASTVYNATEGGVKIVAINTLGVLYLVQSGSEIKNISDLEGKTIYSPAQNPSFILKYLLKKNNINATVDTTYANPADLRTNLVAGTLGENAIAVLPEPMVTIAKNANKSLSVALDLTEEWNKVSDTQLVQGCVVVRTEFLENNKKAVDKFLDEYEASIEYLQENVDDAAALVAKHKIFENQNVAKLAIPNCNVTYMDGSNMKNAMLGFLSAMMEIEPSSIGGMLPGDDFYYNK